MIAVVLRGGPFYQVFIFYTFNFNLIHLQLVLHF